MRALFLFLFLLSSVAFAQNNRAPSGKAEKLAQDLCSCISDYFKEMHPAIQSYMDDLLTVGEAEATRLFSEKVQNMSPQEQQKVQKDAQRMQDVGNDPAFTRCAQLVENATMNDEEALAFQNYVMNSAGCKLMRTFMLLGQAQQETE